MKALTGTFRGAFESFSTTVSTCCGWSEEQPQHGFHSSAEKSFMVLYDQPSRAPPPSVEGMRHAQAPVSAWEQAPRKGHKSGFSVRKRLWPGKSSSSSSRRPQISAPSNFVHVYSGGYNFPEYAEPQAPRRPHPRAYRPLQLSIYEPNNQLTPILPHFDYPQPPVTPPQRALTHSDGTGNSYTLSHERSMSSLSFHMPRKSTNTGSVFDSPRSDVIQRPSPARVRAYTSPETSSPGMNDLIERIATAMLERDKLQEQIDDVIERQSIYISSRPSTATGIRPGTALSIMDMEPMPEVPALPPDAPSFSERLSFDRPQTAPAKNPAVQAAQRGRAYTDTPIHGASSPPSRRVESKTLPPPLPLRLRPPLRPPLRKKKSFSRVSSWLGFPGDLQHSREISIDSVTNHPVPIHAGEGFYQVAPVDRPTRRSSFDSDDTVSDWTSDADVEEEEQTVPTSWSPSSSATVRPVDPSRNVVLGQAPQQIRESRVGVAF